MLKCLPLIAAASLLCASPALAEQAAQFIHSAPISVSTITTTQLIPPGSGAAAGTSIYVTGLNAAVSAAASANAGFQFEYGTGTNCGGGAGPTPLSGSYVFSPGNGINPVVTGTMFVIPPGNAFCVVTTAAQPIAGFVSYNQL